MKKKELKTSNIICIAILGLLPALAVLFRMLYDPTPVSLLTSEWNDELFYFKQVEAIIGYGFPVGYYGFNESHALSLSFAAWSPVLVWPWVVLGLIFGWTMQTVFIYNLLIYVLAMLTFGALVRPTVKQTICLSIWFFAFFLNIRYIFSCMPEVICFSHLIVFWGLMLGYFKTWKRSYLGWAIVLGVVMTFMRPYLILFLVFPLAVMIIMSRKIRRFIAVVVAMAIFAMTAFVYYLLNHYLSAEYLMPFFYTDFITTFFTDGIGAGIHHLFGTLYYKGKDFILYMRDAFYIDRAAGIFFCIYVFMMILAFIQCVSEGTEIRKKRRNPYIGANVDRGPFFCRLYMLFASFAFLIAILLMYKLTEGSKHLLTFIMAGVMLMIMKEKRGWASGLLMSICLLYFGMYHAVGNAYDFGIPVVTEESEARYAYWKKAFGDGMVLDLSVVPSYKNSIIWEFADDVDGESVTTDWQMLYALPKGMGISCCWEYTDDNFDDLNCRYLSMPVGGDIEQMCLDRGYRLVGRDERLAVYARY